MGWLGFAQEDKSARKSPFAEDAPAIELGRVQFRMSCAGCHGLRATGGRSGPDLTRGTFAGGAAEAELYRGSSGGIPGAGMPALGGRPPDGARGRLVSGARTLTLPATCPI